MYFQNKLDSTDGKRRLRDCLSQLPCQHLNTNTKERHRFNFEPTLMRINTQHMLRGVMHHKEKTDMKEEQNVSLAASSSPPGIEKRDVPSSASLATLKDYLAGRADSLEDKVKLGFDNFDDDTYGESLFLKTKMKNTNRIPPPPPGVLPTIDERESKTVEEVIQSTRSTIRENESVNTSKNRKYEIALAGVPVDLRLLNRAETLFNKLDKTKCGTLGGPKAYQVLKYLLEHFHPGRGGRLEERERRALGIELLHVIAKEKARRISFPFLKDWFLEEAKIIVDFRNRLQSEWEDEIKNLFRKTDFLLGTFFIPFRKLYYSLVEEKTISVTTFFETSLEIFKMAGISEDESISILIHFAEFFPEEKMRKQLIQCNASESRGTIHRPNWIVRKRVSTDGKEKAYYFYNKINGKRSWVLPLMMSKDKKSKWLEALRQTDGASFYYNPSTGHRTWNKKIALNLIYKNRMDKALPLPCSPPSFSLSSSQQKEIQQRQNALIQNLWRLKRLEQENVHLREKASIILHNKIASGIIPCTISMNMNQQETETNFKIKTKKDSSFQGETGKQERKMEQMQLELEDFRSQLFRQRDITYKWKQGSDQLSHLIDTYHKEEEPLLLCLSQLLSITNFENVKIRKCQVYRSLFELFNVTPPPPIASSISSSSLSSSKNSVDVESAFICGTIRGIPFFNRRFRKAQRQRLHLRRLLQIRLQKEHEERHNPFFPSSPGSIKARVEEEKKFEIDGVGINVSDETAARNFEASFGYAICILMALSECIGKRCPYLLGHNGYSYTVGPCVSKFAIKEYKIKIEGKDEVSKDYKVEDGKKEIVLEKIEKLSQTDSENCKQFEGEKKNVDEDESAFSAGAAASTTIRRLLVGVADEEKQKALKGKKHMLKLYRNTSEKKNRNVQATNSPISSITGKISHQQNEVIPLIVPHPEDVEGERKIEKGVWMLTQNARYLALMEGVPPSIVKTSCFLQCLDLIQKHVSNDLNRTITIPKELERDFCREELYDDGEELRLQLKPGEKLLRALNQRLEREALEATNDDNEWDILF
eukprot:g4983.t1